MIVSVQGFIPWGLAPSSPPPPQKRKGKEREKQRERERDLITLRFAEYRRLWFLSACAYKRTW